MISSNRPSSQSSRFCDGSLIHPFVDFLAVGGISFFIIPIILLLLPHLDTQSTDLALPIFLVLSVLINWPHFIYSYLLIYDGYRQKIRSIAIPSAQRKRYVWAGIVVPILLGLFVGIAVWRQTSGWLTYFVELYVLTVGWHYTKQGFGMLMNLSAMKGIFFTPRERRFFLCNAYIVWFASWIMARSEPFFAMMHSDPMDGYIFGISILLLPIPLFVVWAAITTLIGSLLLTIGILLRKTGRISFPINATTGYVASLYLWLPMFAIHPLFGVFIPILHSLQYLIFVWRYKAGERAYDQAQGNPNDRFSPFVFSGIAHGFLWFFLVPMLFQLFLPMDSAVYGPMFFLLIFTLFINIHHFFIDNVIWRKENEDVKRYLRQTLA